VALITNGLHLTAETSEDLLNAGVDRINICVDAYSRAIYRQIRQYGCLDTTRSNILYLLKLREQLRKKTWVAVSFKEQTLNRQETAYFRSYWQSQAVNEVIVLQRDAAQGFCQAPWETIVLTARGFLGFCPGFWQRSAEIADYRLTTIQQTWQGEFYRRLREACREQNFTGFSLCAHCPKQPK
jgi:molybdenum cofactor biosynthesis enzyme MoaA